MPSLPASMRRKSTFRWSGNKLTELEQWNKLKLVKEIAETVWGD